MDNHTTVRSGSPIMFQTADTGLQARSGFLIPARVCRLSQMGEGEETMAKKKTQKQKAPTESLKEAMEKALSASISPETFLFASQVYEGAVSGRIPQPKAPSEHGFTDGKKGYVMADIPINRGMMAVTREFRHLSHSERMALGFRLMEFGTFIHEHRDRLVQVELVRLGDGETWDVSEAVHHAAAICPLIKTTKNGREDVGFDVERFFEIAIEEHNRDETDKGA